MVVPFGGTNPVGVMGKQGDGIDAARGGGAWISIGEAAVRVVTKAARRRFRKGRVGRRLAKRRPIRHRNDSGDERFTALVDLSPPGHA
jgi:hypothetical protein